VAEDGDDDLGFVAITFGEQWTNRAIDQARDERFALGRPSFTLEISARDLARGEIFFLVIDGQWEKIDSGFRRVRADSGCENHRLAIGGDHGPVGLTGDPAGFERQLAPTPIEFLSDDIEHSCIPSFLPPDCGRSFLAVASVRRGAVFPEPSQGMG
jgi:hypothetical protein